MLNPKLVFFFPTCQVRVSRSRFYRYYQSWPARRCQLRLCFNCELRSSVGTGGPQPRAPDLSGHCRTSTASARSQWALPDFNASARSQWALPDFNGKRQSSVGIAGPQLREPDLSVHYGTSIASARCYIEYQIECQKRCQIDCLIECQRECRNRCQIRCQIECQNICQIECHGGDHSKKVYVIFGF